MEILERRDKMKNQIKFITLAAIIAIAAAIFFVTGCDVEATDETKTQIVARNLKSNQPTPTDIDYSLERYNLIRRAYWVNGQREKASAVICQVAKPLGYIVLFTDNGAVVGNTESEWP